MRGVVKSFNARRGYGFITGENGQDYFFHYSDILTQKRFKTITVGTDVLFIPTDDGDSTKAVFVEEIRCSWH